MIGSSSLQFVRYLVCAGIAAAVNFFAGVFFYGVLEWNSGVWFPLSVTIAYLAGLVVNFLLNRRFTFHSEARRPLVQFKTFFFVALGGLILTVALSALFRAGLEAVLEPSGEDLSGITKIDSAAHALAIGVVAFYSFLGHKYFTFAQGIRAGIRKLGAMVKG